MEALAWMMPTGSRLVNSISARPRFSATKEMPISRLFSFRVGRM